MACEVQACTTVWWSRNTLGLWAVPVSPRLQPAQHVLGLDVSWRHSGKGLLASTKPNINNAAIELESGVPRTGTRGVSER